MGEPIILTVGQLVGGSITIQTQNALTPPNGMVWYKTSGSRSAPSGWLEAPAIIIDGVFKGVDPNNDSQNDDCYDSCNDTWDGIKWSVREIILPSKDAQGNTVTSIG